MALTKSTNRMAAGSFVNALDFIPEAEHAAIQAKTSTYDASDNLQSAINFGFDNSKTVFIPAGLYKTTKPLIVYGSVAAEQDTDPGSIIIGEGKDATTIQKSGNSNAGTGNPNDSNAVILICNQSWRSGSYDGSLRIRNVYLDGFSVLGTAQEVEYGIRVTAGTFTNSDVRNINISFFTEAGIDITPSSNTNRFHMMRIYGSPASGAKANYGFLYSGGNATSTIWSNIYVLATLVAGFKIKGEYCTLLSSAADSCAGICYDIERFSGTISGCGAESGEAEIIWRFRTNVDAAVVGATTFGNHTTSPTSFGGVAGSASKHIVLGAGSNVSFINSNIAFKGGDDTAVYAGKLYELPAGTAAKNTELHFRDCRIVQYNTASSQAGNSVVTFEDKGTRFISGDGSSLAYMGSRRKSSQYVDHQSNNPVIIAKAIYTDCKDNHYTSKAGTDYSGSTKGDFGDIFLADNPLRTGNLGWVCSRDTFTSHTINGAVDAVPATNTVSVSDLTVNTFSTLGTMLQVGDIISNGSGTTAKVASINYTNGNIDVTNRSGTFTIGDNLSIVASADLETTPVVKIPILHTGGTSFRPTINLVIGQQYFDEQIGKPIWWNGSNWVDAAGTTV